MDERAVIKQYRQILDALPQKHLADAFAGLFALADVAGDWSLRDRCEQQRDVYRQWLQCAVLGIDDPQQEAIFANVVEQIYSLADALKAALLQRFSARLPYELMRTTPPISVADLCNECLSAQGEALEQTERRLFDVVWLSQRWSENERAILTDFLENPLASECAKCLVVSAATLSLLRFYDSDKMAFLLDSCRTPQTAVEQRAVVGAVLALAFHAHRIAIDHAVSARLTALADNAAFRNALKSAYLQLVRTSETEAVTNRIRNEIMPAVVRITPKISDKIDEILARDDEDGLNPDWQDVFDDMGLTDKMQEFSELQLDGADVYAATFAKLKSYPFFGAVANWLLPFDASHSSVTALLDGGRNLFATIMKMPYLCNSDKYSFCLSMAQVAENQRKVMLNGIDAESEQAQEMLNDERFTNPEITSQTVANQYVQDLYRLYTQHPRRADFDNPLAAVWAFYKTDLFAQLFAENATRTQIAEYYLSKGLFADGAAQFEALLADNPHDGSLLQKLGYCYQKMADYAKAADAYSRSDLYLPNTFWTLRRLAFCQRRLGDAAKALEAYAACEKLQPDNFKILLQEGHCLVELKRYKEAIEIYFRADNLQPDDVTCRRAVAWCYLLDSQFDKSLNQYKKLTAAASHRADWLNMAHAYLLLGQRERALACYRHCLALYESSADFFAALTADAPTLTVLGLPSAAIFTLTEALKLV